MKKMPTLFIREFAPNGGILRVTEEVTPGCEWVLNGEGVPTELLRDHQRAVLQAV